MTVADLISTPYALVGGAAGLAFLGYLGGAYHNWFLRRELRRVRIALESLGPARAQPPAGRSRVPSPRAAPSSPNRMKVERGR